MYDPDQFFNIRLQLYLSISERQTFTDDRDRDDDFDWSFIIAWHAKFTNLTKAHHDR